jgi:hypothetical protein
LVTCSAELATPPDDDRPTRAARNEVFFREANELLERESVERGRRWQDFICECSWPGCLERLALEIGEYEHARQRGDWFVVKPGHEDPAIEVVVERHPDYLLVEKTGEGAVIARAEDPR